MISRQRKGITWLVITIGTLVLLYLFPLFHIVSLDDANKATAKATAAKFDPVKFVDTFWDSELLPSKSAAVDAATLVAKVKSDPAKAREQHGRHVGLSQSYFYHVTGVGRVVSVEKNFIGLAISPDSEKTEVILEAGILFGNTVRDGTGLLDVNDFNNTQDFNAISTELNRRIEANVLPTLREIATVGAEVRFTGCVQVNDEDSDLQPLKVVPFIVEPK